MPEAGDEVPHVEVGLSPSESADAQRFLPTGDEAGSAPEDRAFRPDVEGLRAVAILMVVLFHAGVPQLKGGFFGVDVFFVISGFVITGLLLRERRATGGTSFLRFYARRARRILPAALLVIVASLIATDLLVSGRDAVLVASDSRWTALFLSNFHFAAVFPNYYTTRPASPLQQFWSLAVEEQFYLVYPAFFVALLALSSGWSARARLAVGLSGVTVISLLLSVATSKLGQLGTYYSPFTRAWELAVGALVAVGAAKLERIPKELAALMTWIGMALIAIAALTISQRVPLPGTAAVVPVGGAALVIAGGTASPPQWGAEAVLRLLPLRWIGRWSYSWYLWHYPIITIAAEHAHTKINKVALHKNLLLVLLGLVLAAATYFLVENPVRHSRGLARSPRACVVGAALLVGTCVAVTFAY